MFHAYHASPGDPANFIGTKVKTKASFQDKTRPDIYVSYLGGILSILHPLSSVITFKFVFVIVLSR